MYQDCCIISSTCIVYYMYVLYIIICMYCILYVCCTYEPVHIIAFQWQGHRGEWGIWTPTFLQNQFCNSSKYDKKLVGSVISKLDMKSSHQTGKTFHKSYNNDIQFPLCFSYSFLL